MSKADRRTKFKYGIIGMIAAGVIFGGSSENVTVDEKTKEEPVEVAQEEVFEEQRDTSDEKLAAEEAAEMEYMQFVSRTATQYSEASKNLSQTLPRMEYTEDWIFEVALDLVLIQETSDEILEIKDVPEKYKEVDKNYKKAAQHYKNAVDYVIVGIDEFDPDSFGAATKEIEEAAKYTLKATDEIDLAHKN